MRGLASCGRLELFAEHEMQQLTRTDEDLSQKLHDGGTKRLVKDRP